MNGSGRRCSSGPTRPSAGGPWAHASPGLLLAISWDKSPQGAGEAGGPDTLKWHRPDTSPEKSTREGGGWAARGPAAGAPRPLGPRSPLLSGAGRWSTGLAGCRGFWAARPRIDSPGAPGLWQRVEEDCARRCWMDRGCLGCRTRPSSLGRRRKCSQGPGCGPERRLPGRNPRKRSLRRLLVGWS